MKNFFFVLAAFLFGFIAVIGYQYYQARQLKLVATPDPVPARDQSDPEPTFALVPPSQAINGILTIIKGKADMITRTDSEYKEASSGAQILLGESVATKEDASAIAEFSGIVTVSMGPVSELVFANLFPENIVLQQKNGKIVYVVRKPISVRALHSLVTMNPGTVTVNIIDTDVSVTVTSGSVKLAIVDTDNTTRIYDLKTKERANIDDAAREVFLVKAR